MNTTKAELDGIFEVKLDDKQKGYLWAKLSPKSKTKIQQLIAAHSTAILDEVEKLLPKEDERTATIGFSRDSDGTPVNFQYIYEYAQGFNQALSEVQALLTRLRTEVLASDKPSVRNKPNHQEGSQ